MASVITALAADCACVVAGVDALRLVPLGTDLALDLDLLFLDRGAVAVLQRAMVARFHRRGCRVRVVMLTGLEG